MFTMSSGGTFDSDFTEGAQGIVQCDRFSWDT